MRNLLALYSCDALPFGKFGKLEVGRQSRLLLVQEDKNYSFFLFFFFFLLIISPYFLTDRGERGEEVDCMRGHTNDGLGVTTGHHLIPRRWRGILHFLSSF